MTKKRLAESQKVSNKDSKQGQSKKKTYQLY